MPTKNSSPSPTEPYWGGKYLEFYSSMTAYFADLRHMLERSNGQWVAMVLVNGARLSGRLHFRSESSFKEMLEIESPNGTIHYCWINRIVQITLPRIAWPVTEDTTPEDQDRLTVPLPRLRRRDG